MHWGKRIRGAMSHGHGTTDGRPFDHYADDYQALLSSSVAFSGEGAEYFARYKLERIRALCWSSPPVHILDIGCGIGLLTELLARTWPSARVTGFDLSPKSLDHATARCAGLENISWHLYDGKAPPASVTPADLVVLANVLHHIEPTARESFLHGVVLPTMLPGGRLVVFEHNPYNPLTRRVVRCCPFDRDAKLLSLGSVTALFARCRLRVLRRDYIVWFPRPLRGLRRLERVMGWLPLGAQYMVVGEMESRPNV